MTFSDDEDFEECRSFNDLSNNIQSHNSFDATVTITNTEHDFDFDDKLKVKRSDESVGSASNINKTVDIQNTEQISNTTVNVSNASSDMLASNYLNQSANLSHNNISNKSTDILPELNHVEIGLTETGDAGWTNSIHEPTLDCDENNGNSENLKIEEPTDTAYRADSLEPDIQYDFSEHTDKTVQNDEPMEQSRKILSNWMRIKSIFL